MATIVNLFEIAKKSLKFRDTRASLQSYFDYNFYAQIYCHDIPEGMSPLDHYIKYGRQKRFDPSPYFSTNFYLNAYPDVAKSEIDPYVHYLKYGKAEHRTSSKSDHQRDYVKHLVEDVFDGHYYVSQLDDDHCVSQSHALDHYLNFGAKNGKAPNRTFNVRDYKAIYPNTVIPEISLLEDFAMRSRVGPCWTSVKDCILGSLKTCLSRVFFHSCNDFFDKAVSNDAEFFDRYARPGYLIAYAPENERVLYFIQHYVFLLSTIKDSVLDRLIHGPISLCLPGEGNEIQLSFSKPFPQVGELSLTFCHHGREIFVFSFNIVSGEIFDFDNKPVLVIGRIQGFRGCLDITKTVTKDLKEVSPCFAVFAALQGLARAWGISRIVSVSSQRQLARSEKYANSYDDFLEANGAWRHKKNVFVADLPLKHKPLSEIKQSHRKRTRRKREIKTQIETAVAANFSHFIREDLPSIHLEVASPADIQQNQLGMISAI